MKKVIAMLVTLLAMMQVTAQNSMAAANDEERIAVGVMQPAGEEAMPEGTFKVLSNRLSKAASLNGMAVEGEGPVFNMVPSVSVLEKSVAGTVPPMIVLDIEVSVKLVENLEGKSYEQVDFPVKGTGQSEEKAYTDAIRKIDARNPKLKAFFRSGKERILQYYNGNCPVILAKADGHIHARRYLEAYHLLMSTPPASRECFDKCMEKIATFGNKVPSEYQEPVSVQPVADEPVAENDPRKRVVLKNGLILQYIEGKNFGEQTVLNFQIINTGPEQEVFKSRPSHITLINSQGEELKMITLSVGSKTESYLPINYTILTDTPVAMQCTFPRTSYVRQLVLKINDNTYRLDRLPIK